MLARTLLFGLKTTRDTSHVVERRRTWLVSRVVNLRSHHKKNEPIEPISDNRMRSHMNFTQLAIFALAACALCAAPSRAEVSPAAAKLFARAANVYGNARSLTLGYRVTSDNAALPAAESGRIWWSRPQLFAHTWTYAAGSGHVAADEKQVYFTDVDGHAGRRNWKGEFGFWTSLPYQLPGNLEFLLRGQKIPLGSASVRSLKPQKLEGVWCDGALLDLRRVNGDTIRFWFARKTGLLLRESWAVALPESNEIAQVQTRYFNIVINPKLERGDFVRAAEETAPISPASDSP